MLALHSCSTINGATAIAVNGGDTASTVGATANTVNGITVSGSLKDLKRVNPFSLNMRTLRKIASWR